MKNLKVSVWDSITDSVSRPMLDSVYDSVDRPVWDLAVASVRNDILDSAKEPIVYLIRADARQDLNG